MAKTLIRVRRGAKKKCVKLEEVCFSDFLCAGKLSVLYKSMEEQVTVFCKWSADCLVTVQEKCVIPEDTILAVTDDHSEELDEDVFPELATKEICFVIYTYDGRALNHFYVCREKLWNLHLKWETSVCWMSTYVLADNKNLNKHGIFSSLTKYGLHLRAPIGWILQELWWLLRHDRIWLSVSNVIWGDVHVLS